jgi:hypothetical protein
LVKKRSRKQRNAKPAPVPWYTRTATKIGAVVLSIGVGVSISVLAGALTGPTQRALGTSPKTPANAVPAASSSAPSGAAVPLVKVKATKLGGEHSFVSAGPITLSTEQRRAPRMGDEDTVNTEARTLNDLGAVETQALAIDLDLSTKSDEQVRIKDIRVAQTCRAPLKGTLFFDPPAGPPEPIGKIGFNLDAAVPIAQRITDNEEWGAPQFSNYVQYVKKGDGFAYHIVARAYRHYCEFRLLVDATAGDRAETVSVDDGGRPFRVSGLLPDAENPRRSDFKRLYVAGVVAPQDRDETYKWFAENPKTYRP